MSTFKAERMIFIVAVLNTNVFACAGEGKKSYNFKNKFTA